MNRNKGIAIALAFTACVVLTGCMPKMTIEQMKADMPQRPAALDMLDAFVGKWEYTGEARFEFLDEPLKSSGTSESHWEGNRWYLVNRGTMKMEHFDDTEMIEVWGYDIKDKKFRSFYVDGMGMMGAGESTYNEKTGTWHMKASSHSPWGKSTIKGTMKFLDDDTMEWTMTEQMGLMKIMEMTGTGHRVK